MLKLRLFGPPRIELNDTPVHIVRRKALALLVYLVVTDRPHSRDALATLFYPELDQSRARAYFRRDLGVLNSELEGDWLAADHETVSLNEAAGIWMDVSQFRGTLAGREEHPHLKNETCPDCLLLIAKASELYGDHFLAGFSLPDAPEFDEWHFFEAEKLRQELATALEQLVAGYVIGGEYDEAIPYAQRLLKLDPLHEPAQRTLMKLYALSGQQAAALRQYDSAVTLLEEELGIAPDEETTQLYQAIKARRYDQIRLAGQIPSDTTPPELVAKPLPAFLEPDEEPDLEATVFVAREEPLAQLEAALDSARAGQGQIKFITGGAGRGKTTLIREFARRAEADDPELVIVTGYCNAIVGIGDPYLPFREALTMLTGDVEARWAGGLISRQQARQLWGLVPITLPALVKHAPDLVNRFVPAEALRERATKAFPNNKALLDQIAALTTAGKREALDQTSIFAQYAAMLKAVAARRPILHIIEDLHWVDAASSGLLFHLSRELGDSQILLVGTYRPDEVALDRSAESKTQHPLADIVSEIKRQHGDVWLDLSDLTSLEGRRFAEAYLDTQPNRLDKAFREALFQRTGGHALFTVELLRAMQERGDLMQGADGYWVEGEGIDWTILPAKVEGVIERRIKRLPESLQSILTTASVEGETFAAEVVARVQKVDERGLVRQLSRELDKRHQLVTAQGIEWLVSGRQRLSVYRFQHQLFQHHLYRRLDDVEKGYLHEAVGDVLEELYEGRTEEIAGRLAHHFQAAGLVEKAIRYLTQAGDAAAAVSAHIEAVDHYKRAVELAEQVETGTEELADLYTRLGGQLNVTKGDGTPEVGQAFGRAYELYQQVGDSPQRFAALRGLAMYHKLQGESAIAQELSEQMLELANSIDNPVLTVEACYAFGSLAYYMGEFVQAQTYLDRGIESYDLRLHQSLISLYGQDPGVANLAYASMNLWLLGYPNRAISRCFEALALAQELAHPYSEALAHAFISWTSLFRREEQTVLEHTKAIIDLSVKHDYLLFAAVGKLLGGWALATQTGSEAGIIQMQQILSGATLTQENEVAPPHLLALLADACGSVGQYQEGLQVIRKAQMAIENDREFLHIEAEIYRLKGELLLHRGERQADPEESVVAEAEANFRQAINIARRQEAKSLELRAVVSLSRLWQSLGKKEAARSMLAEIYGWFSEGFDTRDLIEAKTLLEDLAPG